jgi:acyl carrier protein
MGTTSNILQGIIWSTGKGTPGEDIAPSADLAADIGLDSYDVIETILMIEVHGWGVPVEVSEDDMRVVRTFGDLVRLIDQKLTNGGVNARPA